MNRHGKVGETRETSLLYENYIDNNSFSPEQLYSLSFQILQIREFHPRRMLEIGIGNGFVSTFLKKIGIEVITVDINPALGADICSSIAELPNHLRNERFDLVSCCEVLEHIPFEYFDSHLEILRGFSPNAFISLPGHFPWLGFTGRLGVHNRFMNISLGLRIPCKRKLTDGHYWEIASHWQTRKSAILKTMHRQYALIEAGVFPMHRYHYYFRCTNGGRNENY